MRYNGNDPLKEYNHLWYCERGACLKFENTICTVAYLKDLRWEYRVLKDSSKLP